MTSEPCILITTDPKRAAAILNTNYFRPQTVDITRKPNSIIVLLLTKIKLTQKYIVIQQKQKRHTNSINLTRCLNYNNLFQRHKCTTILNKILKGTNIQYKHNNKTTFGRNNIVE